MKELSEMIQDSCKSLSDSGKIEEMVSKGVEKLVSDILSRELESYSDFGKNLKEHIKLSLGVDFSKLGISGYNDHIIRVIGEIMDKKMHGESKAKLEAAISEMLVDPPKEIKLSEIISKFKEHFNEAAQEGNIEQMTCLVEDRNDKFFTYISMDKEEGKEKYQCAYRFGLSLNRETGVRTVYTMILDGENLKKGLFVGPFYSLERLMYQMHCCGTSVILDVEDHEMDLEYDTEEREY